jgi:hypothetical protein
MNPIAMDEDCRYRSPEPAFEKLAAFKDKQIFYYTAFNRPIEKGDENA